MAFAQGSRHEMSYVAEATYGTTPATPSMLKLRHVGTTLNLTKDAFVSQELRSDRMIFDARHGVKQVGGEINFEASYGAFDDILEAALQGVWSGSPANILKAGTTFKSFSMERRFTDITQFLVYTGCGINSMNLSITPNAIVTGSFGVVGKSMTTSGVTLGAPTDVATNAPFDAFTGTIQEGGVSIATITAIELALSNGIEPTFVIGSDSTPELVSGRSTVTGTVSAYFEDLSLLNKFLNETESSIQFELSDPSANTLTFLLPRIKYTGGDVPVQGEGALMLNMPFQALLDDVTENTNLKITRS